MTDETVYLGIGANQGDVYATLQKVICLLRSHPDFMHVKFSRFYRSAPVEMHSPDWFINAVCSFQTLLSPEALFAETCKIEIACGKVPKAKTADRPIDLDILFYGSSMYTSASLQIPHPRWNERLFVLKPLVDLTRVIQISTDGGDVNYDIEELIFQPNLSSQLVILEENLDIQ